jgi:phosphatidate cytidylyltransferase|tara:strand:- start:102234 stop:103052 length:819 start_codon:yes stop_codon:yes gene_type:complete
VIARLTTGISAGALFLVAIFLPVPGLFVVVAGAVLIVAAREWSQLCGFGLLLQIAYVIGLALSYVFFLVQLDGLAGALLPLVVLAFSLWILAIPLLIFYRKSQAVFSNTWLVAVSGAVFLLSASLGLVWLKTLPDGEWRVTLLVGLVAVADTFAYLAGRRFGCNKLAADISPAKTMEGALGGFVGNFILAGILVVLIDFSPISNSFIVALILGASLLSIVGDLTESAIKRHSGVKDSGDLLPGHGGILDRIDGLLAATPFFVLATMLFSALS